MKQVFIVMDTEAETGSDSIKGVFTTGDKAKLFLAEYVLENKVDSSYLEIVPKRVTPKKKDEE